MLSTKPVIQYFRPSLNRLLDRILETPLTVVEAPMGYGKTTAVRGYVKNAAVFTLWKTVDSDSVHVFWQGFTRLLAKISPDCAQRLVKMGFPDSDLLLDEAIANIDSLVFPEKTVFVIDDYHLLLSSAVDRFVELLVKAEISNFHIVILSRVSFGDNTTELVLKGYCTHITKHCFELSKTEMVEYYKKCGVRLTSQEASQLFDYTEGWISALYLCLLSYLQDGRIERQASLHDLLDKVTYRTFPEEIKEFLLTICIFDSFVPEQAEMMWPRGNAKSIIRKLMRMNAFISFDQSNQRFHVHNIFTSYLREIFARKPLSEQQSVWQRAGNWYMQAQEYIPAMDSYYKACDPHSLLHALEMDKGLGLTVEMKDKMIAFYQSCPPEIKRTHPRACLIYAMSLFAFNEIALFAEECRQLANLADCMPSDCGMTAEQLKGETELLTSFASFNDIPKMAVHYRKACDILDAPSCYYDRNSSWTFESPSVLHMFHRKQGKLDQEVCEVADNIPYYYKITDNHGYGAEHAIQAERHYFCGDFEQAEIVAHTALHAARSANQPAISICALFIQLRLALVQGNVAAVNAALQQLHAETEKVGLPDYYRTLELCEGFLYSNLALPKKISAWILEGNAEKSQLPFPTYAFYNMLFGKTLLDLGEYLKLLGIIGYFKEIAEFFPTLLSLIYTHIYESIAHSKLGHIQAAQDSLRQALDMACPDQLLMPFVENGADIVTVLESLTEEAPYREFIARVVRIHPSFAANLGKVQKALTPTELSTASLTVREREIADLVSSGLSNNRIAQQLFVSEVTVKKTLQNIYAKLGINNRTALTKLLIEQKAS